MQSLNIFFKLMVVSASGLFSEEISNVSLVGIDLRLSTHQVVTYTAGLQLYPLVLLLNIAQRNALVLSFYLLTLITFRCDFFPSTYELPVSFSYFYSP